MNKHLLLAKHNKAFHTKLTEAFPDDFFDWKSTVIFYTSYHYLHALADHWKVRIGESHSEIFSNINPRNQNRSMKLQKGAYDLYNALYETSIATRYHGIIKPEMYKLSMLHNHKICIEALAKFESYLKSKGLMI